MLWFRRLCASCAGNLTRNGCQDVSRLLKEILDCHEQPDVAKADDKQYDDKILARVLGKGRIDDKRGNKKPVYAGN